MSKEEKEVIFKVGKKALDKVFVYLQNKPYVEVFEIIKSLSEDIQKNVEKKEKEVKSKDKNETK